MRRYGTIAARAFALLCLPVALSLAQAKEPTPVKDGDHTGKHIITVFAAASTTDALTTLANKYETAHNVTIRLNFASSSVLARQIEQDAHCDIFLSADQKWMDALADKHLIRQDTRKDILGNHLVLITPAAMQLTVEMTNSFNLASAFSGRLAVGDPDHVPAGIYAKESLISLGWWTALEKRLLPTETVRAALRLVEMHEVDAGIVYLSDALSSYKVVIAGEFPDDTHSPIRYPVALCATAGPAANGFLKFISNKAAAQVWADEGFDPIEE